MAGEKMFQKFMKFILVLIRWLETLLNVNFFIHKILHWLEIKKKNQGKTTWCKKVFTPK